MDDASSSNVPELLDIQKEALEFIERNFKRGVNTLCATGVGSGKTRIACEVIKRHLTEQKGYILVCCPSVTLIYSPWEETLSSLGMKTRILSDKEFHSNIRRGSHCFNPINRMTYLITYKMLISNTKQSFNTIFFKNKPPSLIVFDEMHFLSNNANTDKVSREHIAGIPAQRKLGLTATPMVNETAELACAAGILNGTSANDDSGFLFSRKKTYDLTECRQCIIGLPLSTDEYDTLNEIVRKIPNEFARMSISQKLLVTGSGKYDCNTYICEDGKTKSRALQEILCKIPKSDKIIVFDRQKEILNHLYRQQWMKGYNPVMYHGGLPDKKQHKNYEEFINNPDARIMLATEQIAGEGLNLQAANHIIILSYGWTPKDIIQMSGRVKRLGQKKDVFIYILKAKDSGQDEVLIEDDQLSTIKSKHEEIENFLSKYPETTVSLKNPDFELAEETVPGLFLDNGKIEEDVDRLMDSIQKEYIKKEMIRKSSEIIYSALPRMESYFNFNETKNETIQLLKNIGLTKKYWKNIEGFCRLLIDYEELERQYELKNEYMKLEDVVNAEMEIRQDSGRPVINLGFIYKSDIVELIHKYLTFLSEENP